MARLAGAVAYRTTARQIDALAANAVARRFSISPPPSQPGDPVGGHCAGRTLRSRLL